MAKYDVCVVGSTNVDLTSYMDRMPKPGETMHGRKFVMSFGGKGANQCVMAAKMGGKTCMITKLGKDTFGKDCMENFKSVGVATEGVLISENTESSTGIASIYVDASGMNSIVVSPGTNFELTCAELDNCLELIRNSEVVVCQLEIEWEVSLQALRMGRTNGAVTVFNPAPATKDLDTEFFKVSDIFCLNETEAEIITGLPVATDAETEAAAKAVLAKGAKVCVMTLGERGSLIASFGEQGEMYTLRVPATPVKCVDSCGAGDSFLGALAYYLAKTNPASRLSSASLEETVRKSGQIATISVQKAGAQSSYPSREEIPQHLL
eukprot:Nk52_evm29s2474 gene=Nk52_evmTU29s2474